MPGEPSTEQKIIDLLIKNREEILMQEQSQFCCEKNGQKRLVYKSPLCYELGNLIESLINERKQKR